MEKRLAVELEAAGHHLIQVESRPSGLQGPGLMGDEPSDQAPPPQPEEPVALDEEVLE